MSGRSAALLALLADGARQPGSGLAAQLGVTADAVPTLVAELRGLGIELRDERRSGYSLARPVELLDAARIRAASRYAAHPWLAGLELEFAIESTNGYLGAAPPPPPGRPRIVIAELQTRGRGRRGRRWNAPLGSGLTVSLGWSFATMPAEVPALSLALGVAVAETLHAVGARDLRVKWPNDLVGPDGKLGGLLVETRSEAGRPACVVVGLGLNLDLPRESRPGIAEAGALPPIDLRELLGGAAVARNALAATVIDALLAALDEYGRGGFAAFRERWNAVDGLRDRPVTVLAGDLRTAGVARGVDHDGALRVEIDGDLRRFVSGEVSLRPAAKEPAA